MNSVKIILGLVPFALYALLAGVMPVGWAALIGMLAAVVAVIVELRGGIKAVPVVGIVVLGAFAWLGFAGDPFVQSLLEYYGRGLATLALAIYMLVTAGFAPFTAQFARQSVPKQYWKSERFIRINRHLSLAWGGVVLVTAVCHLIAGGLVVAGASAPIIVLGLNWAIPVFAILWTVKYTKRVVGADTPAATPAS
jgi:hypothetical protein